CTRMGDYDGGFDYW
nr:immunoglobulin heavy chain junction region [Mus musculus]